MKITPYMFQDKGFLDCYMIFIIRTKEVTENLSRLKILEPRYRLYASKDRLTNVVCAKWSLINIKKAVQWKVKNAKKMVAF